MSIANSTRCLWRERTSDRRLGGHWRGNGVGVVCRRHFVRSASSGRGCHVMQRRQALSASPGQRGPSRVVC